MTIPVHVRTAFGFAAAVAVGALCAAVALAPVLSFAAGAAVGALCALFLPPGHIRLWSTTAKATKTWHRNWPVWLGFLRLNKCVIGCYLRVGDRMFCIDRSPK